jgi:hypothetical protein
MFKRIKPYVLVAVTGIVLAAAGCARPPQDQIQAAQDAVAQASQVEAESYAPEAWGKAQQSMSAAMAEVEAQQARFALTRSYKTTRQLLDTARADAEAAKIAAEEGKRQAAADAEAALLAVTESLVRADEMLGALAACPRRPKGFAQDLELLKGSVEGLRSQVTDVESVIADEDYLEGKSLAESLRDEVDEIVADLDSARAKLGC